MKTTMLCVFLAILLLSFPTQAKEDSWQFRLAPYLWFAGLKGDIATIPSLPAVPVDISSSDALKHRSRSDVDVRGKNSATAYFLILSTPI